jgi:hypothetical protein
MGTEALTAQWPAGVAHGWATVVSNMTQVMTSLYMLPHAAVLHLHLDASIMFRASTMMQQLHMHIKACWEGVGLCQGLVLAATMYCFERGQGSIVLAACLELRTHLPFAPCTRRSGAMLRSQSQPKLQQGAFVPTTATHDDCAQCSVLSGLCLTLLAGGAIGKDEQDADAVYQGPAAGQRRPGSFSAACRGSRPCHPCCWERQCSADRLRCRDAGAPGGSLAAACSCVHIMLCFRLLH